MERKDWLDEDIVTDRNSASDALDELFQLTRQFKSSQAFRDMLHFVGRFKFYSPFNAMLVHTQMTGATYVATPSRWLKDFGRQIRVGARPLVMLRPRGPVMFVYDVSDTVPDSNARPLPPQVESPFEVRHGKVGDRLEKTIANALRDGLRVSMRDQGSQSAGFITKARAREQLRFEYGPAKARRWESVPLRYELILNSNLSREARYATLVHELTHLYCGHLGSPNPSWWSDRRELSEQAREFEAESVCYLVCERAGISNPSEEYLADYLGTNENVPSISLDCIMRAVGLIGEMGQKRFKPRVVKTTL